MHPEPLDTVHYTAYNLDEGGSTSAGWRVPVRLDVPSGDYSEAAQVACAALKLLPGRHTIAVLNSGREMKVCRVTVPEPIPIPRVLVEQVR
jgi:hypothetical protein